MGSSGDVVRQPIGRVLRASTLASLVVFGLLAFGMTMVWLSGVRDHERIVVTLVTLCSVAATLAAIRTLQGAIDWAPVQVVAAVGLALAVYLGESELRNDLSSGYAILFISLPVLLAVALAMGYRGTRRLRRERERELPHARVR